MSKKLIIAEKPSLGKNIVSAIGNAKFKNCKNYYESDDYIVTWAFGHLFSLVDIEDYKINKNPEEKKFWKMEDIPCFPENFKFELKKDQRTQKTDYGVSNQYSIICKLISRNDVDSIINAGDSDREGEIIVRIILQEAKCQKTIYRLWMPDQTSQTINAALKDLPLDTNYDNLANEGLARTYIDWLYGVNLTRYATLKCHSLMRVGRIVSPIVEAIYEKEMEIRAFVPRKYFSIISKEKTKDFEIALTSSKRFEENEKDKAIDYCNLLNSQIATVKNIKKEEKIIAPGKLYSLSKLQGVLGKRFKMTPKKSLEIIQNLYEKGFVTYPRTNTEYLATNEKGKFSKIIDNIKSMGYDVTFKDSKYIFDDSKIESHSAICPTFNIPKKTDLNEDEYKIYQTIFKRFAAVFCNEPFKVEHTEITIGIGDTEDIIIKGDITITPGWSKYDEYTGKEKELPPFEIGETIAINFKPEEKKDTPPDRYTTDSFYKYLKNPFKKEEATDEEEYKAIFSGVELGTEATRTGIIDNAISSGYISLKQNKYYLEPGGEKYIEKLRTIKVLMSKNKTAQLGMILKDVFKNKKTIDEAVKLTEGEISALIDQSKSIQIENDYKELICPICSSVVKTYEKGYACSKYGKGCTFLIPKQFAQKYITRQEIQNLLTNKQTNIIKGFIGKNGTPFDAKLILDDNFKVQYVLKENIKDEEKEQKKKKTKKDSSKNT